MACLKCFKPHLWNCIILTEYAQLIDIDVNNSMSDFEYIYIYIYMCVCVCVWVCIQIHLFIYLFIYLNMPRAYIHIFTVLIVLRANVCAKCTK